MAKIARSPQPSPSSIADATLQFRPVRAIGCDLPLTCGDDDSPCTEAMLLSTHGITLDGPDGLRFQLGALLLAGGDVARVSVTEEPMGLEEQQGDHWAVNLRLTEEATSVFAAATSKAVARPQPLNQIAVVVDGVVLMSPEVLTPIENGRIQITGFSREEADALAENLAAQSP
jgi:preprotein translocase subunit SecD